MTFQQFMLNNFKNKYLGKQVEFHSFGNGAYNQCVDLVNQYIKEVLNLTPIIGTNAKDFKDKFNPDEFEWIVNTPEAIIKAGDIPVWNGRVGGGAGHIAIALEDGDVNKFISLDQNWSQVERVTVESHTYANVAGWLRPKKAQVDDSQKVIDELRTERDKNWNLYQDLLTKVGELTNELETVKKQRDESDKAIITLNTKIESLNTAMAQDAVNDKDILLHAKELEEERDKANLELSGIGFQLGVEPYDYEKVLKTIEELKKPKEEVISYYDKLLKDIWPNLIRGKKTRSIIDRIWRWIQ